jgi:hypothetical protein
MRLSVTLLALTLLLALPSLQAASAEVGEAAPGFTLTDSNGIPRALSDFAGKTVVLEWTNHQCPFVVKHYGAANIPSQQRAAVKDAVVWLVINSSAAGKQGHVDGPTANQIQADWKAAQTHYLFDSDGQVGRMYAAKTTPHLYVIDPKGVLRYNGAIDSIPSADRGDIAQATQYVPQVLSELAAGKPVSVRTSQPYGCSIKYADA